MNDIKTPKEEKVHKGWLIFDLTDDPELVTMLNKYRISLGWTWKRFMLMGMAHVIKDNDDLVIRIADYIEGRR